MRYVDLHIHSIYSDGTLSPREIVERAVKNGVGAISVTDHDVIGGTLETEGPARAAGLDFVRGVEIDALFGGRDFHILCYGADFGNARLLEIIRDARKRMDAMSARLLARMRPDYPALDPDEYEAFSHDAAQGGWKMLQYLRRKGLTASLTEGMRFYGQYGVTYEQAGFRPVEEVVEAIHLAGGRAVLAHLGATVAKNHAEVLERLLDTGLDGVECYYPKHTRAVERLCLAACRRRGLLVSAGSDCHGAFQTADIGQTRTTRDKVSLELLGAK